MKKYLIWIIVLISVLIVIVAAFPLEKIINVRLVGRSAMIKIVNDDFSDTGVTGFVKYSKNGSCLSVAWVIYDLPPGEQYKLILHSMEGDPRVAEACGINNSEECGYLGEEGYLVMGISDASRTGKVNERTKECRLSPGDYEDAKFIVKQINTGEKAWTQEYSEDTDLDYSKCPTNIGGGIKYLPGDPWCGDLSTFTIN